MKQSPFAWFALHALLPVGAGRGAPIVRLGPGDFVTNKQYIGGAVDTGLR